jgi:SNF family Na+-dependent transporter
MKDDTAVIGEGRERWSSRTAFYFAAVGAAVGFGNVWRFRKY